MSMRLWLALLAAAAFPVGAAANPGGSMSLSLNPALVVSLPAPDGPATGSALEPAAFALAVPLADYAQYRPRIYRLRPRRSSMPAMPFAAQFHFGFLNPINNFSTGFNGGFRVGPKVDPHILIGLGVDWWRRSENTVLNLGDVHVPGSIASEELILSESTAHLIPFLFFVQLSGNENAPVVPYAGFGTGYEWLSLAANDFVTHESFNETFGGFGWQAWAGAGLQLDRRMRLNAELFFNCCDVDSEVDVILEGYGPATVRDVISVDGVGMRFGACWLF